MNCISFWQLAFNYGQRKRKTLEEPEKNGSIEPVQVHRLLLQVGGGGDVDDHYDDDNDNNDSGDIFI